MKEVDESVVEWSIGKIVLGSIMGGKQFYNGKAGKLTLALNTRLLPSLAPLPRPAIDLPKIATIVGGTGVGTFPFHVVPNFE